MCGPLKAAGRVAAGLACAALLACSDEPTAPTAESALLARIGDAGGKLFTTSMTGAEEVPGPGDPDGSGTFSMVINPGQSRICFEIAVADILLPATGAHIHDAPAGSFSGVVVPLVPPNASGFSSGCAAVDAELLRDIRMNPEQYYVNVHTSEFTAGAVRGQLGD